MTGPVETDPTTDMALTVSLPVPGWQGERNHEMTVIMLVLYTLIRQLPGTFAWQCIALYEAVKKRFGLGCTR